MQLKNPEIFAAIESIGEHYRSNIANRFTRRALSAMNLDQGTWNLIEELTEKVDNYRYQGYHLDELYGQILAMSRFIYQARRDVAPNLRYTATTGNYMGATNPADKVFRDMAINNFLPNLKILADKINELYVKVAAIDKAAAGPKPPIYSQLSELHEIGRYLVE